MRCSDCLNIQTQADRQVCDLSDALQAAISLIPPERLPDVDQRLHTLIDMHDRAEWARTAEHEAWRAKANALLNVLNKIAEGHPEPAKLAKKAQDISFRATAPFRSRFEEAK